MDATDKVVLAGAVAGVTALIIALRNSSKKENQSSMSGNVVRLRPTAPISPAANITAVQYLNAEGAAAAAPAGGATGGATAPVASTPTVGEVSSTPVVTEPAPTTTAPTTATPPPDGGHHPHHRRRAPYIIYGSPYWWGNPYAWNWGLWNPYGFDKAVYCMNEFGSLTRVRGCYSYETADQCCARKSRRGSIGRVRE